RSGSSICRRYYWLADDVDTIRPKHSAAPLSLLPTSFRHKASATRLRATPAVLYKDIGLGDPPLRSRMTHMGHPCESTLPPRFPPVNGRGAVPGRPAGCPNAA